ncbi:peptidase M24, structural domain-containing protein [Schizophyllum commune]
MLRGLVLRPARSNCPRLISGNSRLSATPLLQLGRVAERPYFCPRPLLARYFQTSFPSRSETRPAMAPHAVNTTDRLHKLRDLMAQDGYSVDAIVIPSEDEHASEYLAAADERRAWISGFTGSAGCAIVTLDRAYLFTDGRYFLQASQQLDDNWTLMKVGMPDVPTWQEFLHKKLPHNSKIGIDSTVISVSDAESISKELAPLGSSLVPLTTNLVDVVWGAAKPARPSNEVFYLAEEFSGESHSSKLQRLRTALEEKEASAMVVTNLDDIAWLFNLRGSDIDYNPVFFAYGVVEPERAIIFTDDKRVTEDAKKRLANDVEFRPYQEIWDYLKNNLKSLVEGKDSKVLIASNASLAVASAFHPDRVLAARSPLADLKANKNDIELEGFRQSHLRDGVALVKYFAWLEAQLNKGVELTEVTAADQLEAYRAAIIHYDPVRDDCATVKKEQVYLCDSGAQFLDGTTDVTRTWHFGTPTEEERRANTRVLQGHIAIATAVFPNGTTGYLLDPWARRYLWQDGLDYRHGTGHGVGAFLNVHEGPQGMGTRITANAVPIKSGMTISNEPGYYADGKFGIRIESIVLARPADTPNNFGDKGYLRFETVTMCPLHKNLIDVSLLSAEDRKWIDGYHQTVWEKLSPLLKDDAATLEWLKKETSPL